MAASRNTIQRKLVLSVVKNACHPTAENVYKAIKNDYPDISLGTVYRNLSLLTDRGEILKIPVPGSADRFDHTTAPHHHAVCVACGAFVDVCDLALNEIEVEVSRKTGYTVLGYQLIFSGLCPECQSGAQSAPQQLAMMEG